jgi:hypothetical protein
MLLRRLDRRLHTSWYAPILALTSPVLAMCNAPATPAPPPTVRAPVVVEVAALVLGMFTV